MLWGGGDGMARSPPEVTDGAPHATAERLEPVTHRSEPRRHRDRSHRNEPIALALVHTSDGGRGLVLEARSGDALRHRHPEPGHPVEHRATDPGFGLLGRQSPGAKTTTDEGFVAEHGRLSERAPAVADRLLPAQAPLVPDRLDVLVPLTGRGARGRARHGG